MPRGRPKGSGNKKMIIGGFQENIPMEEKVKEINEEKNENPQLKKTVNDLTKQFGHEIIHYAIDEPQKERIPTGIETIDKLIGGGIPEGMFSVLWGNKSSTKTTLSYLIIAQAQKRGKQCMYIDLEQSFDKIYAEKMGVDLNRLLVAQFSVAEEAFDSIIKLCNEKCINLIVLDSIQSLSPTGEKVTKTGKEKSVEDDTLALLARKLSQFFRMTANGVAKGKVAILLIGQARTNLSSFIKLDCLSGGHCFPIDTRILTKDGLKYYDEIKSGDLIPTINLEQNKIEYKPIKNKYIYNFDGELNQFKNKYGVEFLFTDKHQCLVKRFKWNTQKQNSSLDEKFYSIVEASKTRRTWAFPISFPSGNKDLYISDNEIRLLGWILTDGSVNKANKNLTNWKKFANRIQIYQTKINYVKEIENILINLKYAYKKTKRIRKDSRKAFRNSKPNYTFYLYNAIKLIEKYKLSDERSIPEFLFNLSDRQAKILFETMLKGDGSRKKKSNLPSYIVDGNKQNIEKLYHFLITHNINTSYIAKHKNAYYLLLKQCDYIGFNVKKKYSYKGKIWDISVDNGLHFIERNGQIIATHNSLQHWSAITLKVYRGSKVDAPRYHFKVGGKTKELIIGFSLNIKIEKTKVSGTAPESSFVTLPFYYEFGFNKPSNEEIEKLYADWIEFEKEE